MQRYNPKEIEPKWQTAWEEAGIYKASDSTDKPKKYVLEYFPYPSGAAMHVGHVRNYVIGDVIARYNRMNGYNVLHPMGWDAFGLPAENYAIKNQVSPRVAIDENTARFKQQLMQMGFSYDWSREIDSTDPKYYRWTQWFFLLLFRKGLAYQKDSMQWWCPHDKTVLANEQVENGRCWRCGNLVEKKALKQWFFRITEYADRLLDDLNDLDWSDAIKSMQRNWIGRSSGAEINFTVANEDTFVLLHGFTGSSKADFFPWVSEALSAQGHSVSVPDMPNTEKPDAREQARYVLEHVTFDKNTVLLGHSYGAVAALRILEQLDSPIKKLVLAAGFAQPGFLDNERNFETTTDWNFNFEKIKQNAQEIILLRDTSDPAVPAERVDYLQKKLGGLIVDFKAESGHITGPIEPIVLDWLLPTLTVFSTRPDTIYGATFMVIAPEHGLAKILATNDQQQAVAEYILATQAKSDVERQDTNREKTGVFTGSYAINPINRQQIPIWISDYVLAGYGTGAIMAVPAHDERDFAFAQKFNLPIIDVVAPSFVGTGMNASRENVETLHRRVVDAIICNANGEYLLQVEADNVHFVGGGIEPEDVDDFAAIKREVIEETGFTDIASIEVVSPTILMKGYRIPKNKNQNTEGKFYKVILNSATQVASEIEEGRHSVKWVKKDEVAKQLTWQHHAQAWKYYLTNSLIYTSEGVLINSGKYNTLSSAEVRELLVKDLAEQHIGKEKINYKIRDWLISRQRYWGAPIPIIHCPDHGAVAVPDDQLPVVLPEIDKYEPSGDGRSPLANVSEFVNTSCPECGGPAERETDTMDGFACSSWYFLRFADPHNATEPFARDKADFWLPVDDYIGGAEHAVMHLLYARFWTKVMYDEGLIQFQEPFTTLRNHGMILAPDGAKMSKSKGNTIEPGTLIDQGYGADSVRIMELFIGPWNQAASWSVEGMGGAHRFLQRIWIVTQEFLQIYEQKQGGSLDDSAVENDILRSVHKTIKKVSNDVNELSFNTAIAALMECLNDLYKLKEQDEFSNLETWRFTLESVLQLLAPFAPHIAEELWTQLGHEESIHQSVWPTHDESILMSDEMTIVVQVNGKLRAELQVASDAGEADIVERAQSLEKLQPYIADKQLRNVIYVPQKLVNFVV
jgi:leucyl-tRNA synthetase